MSDDADVKLVDHKKKNLPHDTYSPLMVQTQFYILTEDQILLSICGTIYRERAT